MRIWMGALVICSRLSSCCSPDGAKRNPGTASKCAPPLPHSASLHAGYGENFLCPKLLGCQPGALGEGGKLRPHHVGIDGRLADPGAVAAVGAGDDVLAPDQPSVASDALGYQVGMLDEVRFGFDHARDQHFSLGQLHSLEQ